MAFAVTPTSGDAPYVLTASFANSHNIDNVLYTASLRYSIGEGNCPPRGTATILPSTLASLLADGTAQLPWPTIESGNCNAITLQIQRVSDNVVVSRETVHVDNIV